MKILLQHTRTLLYLRSSDGWTRNDSEARTFPHSQKAIEFAHEHNLTDVYIAVKFPDQHDDVVAPVPSLRPSITVEATVMA
jgi:hypothetical protein